jgi:hypothetical protein
VLGVHCIVIVVKYAFYICNAFNPVKLKRREREEKVEGS